MPAAKPKQRSAARRTSRRCRCAARWISCESRGPPADACVAASCSTKPAPCGDLRGELPRLRGGERSQRVFTMGAGGRGDSATAAWPPFRGESHGEAWSPASGGGAAPSAAGRTPTAAKRGDRACVTRCGEVGRCECETTGEGCSASTRPCTASSARCSPPWLALPSPAHSRCAGAPSATAAAAAAPVPPRAAVSGAEAPSSGLCSCPASSTTSAACRPSAWRSLRPAPRATFCWLGKNAAAVFLCLQPPPGTRALGTAGAAPRRRGADSAGGLAGGLAVGGTAGGRGRRFRGLD